MQWRKFLLLWWGLLKREKKGEKKGLLASFLSAKQIAFFMDYVIQVEEVLSFRAWERMCCTWSRVGPVLKFTTRHCLKAVGSMLKLLDTEKNAKPLPSTAVRAVTSPASALSSLGFTGPVLVGNPSRIPELWHRGCHCTAQAARATMGLWVGNLWSWR